jgi:hypothetical protein
VRVVRRIGTIVFAVIAGCGRFGFEPLGGPGGGSDGDGSDGGDGDSMPSDGWHASYREAVLADTPLAYFRLADTNTIAVDETGRTTGVYSGGCTRGVAGLLTNDPSPAVRFDGNTCRIELSGNLEFNQLAPFSVELWARQESLNNFQSLFMNEIRQGGTPREGYALVSSPSLNGVFLERYGGNTSRITSQYTTQTAVIKHYVGTYDGSTLRLYVDGVEYGVANTDASQIVDQAGSIPIIGNFPPAFGDLATHGTLDEVAIYDKALTANRIAIHHAIGRNGP